MQVSYSYNNQIYQNIFIIIILDQALSEDTLKVLLIIMILSYAMVNIKLMKLDLERNRKILLKKT